ncbi:TPA: hypothetical protein N0F65_002379 [Lagenidium giganteum]|uniref:Reverse transcriptase Ty1/copia-type domain-containing protein n=1 Tax=Lagenidium giganteum TaxID=4803 RepID=A0AAV2YKZ1_9STRA|nr:TPA: hypothetical protein N0F65_002379 [Lagenidium giganteum]
MASIASGPQVLTKTDCSAKNPILSAVERLNQAEALVALENVADKVYMDVYVDDVLVVAKTRHGMCELKQTLGSEFKAKDLGDVHFSCLDWRFRRDRARRRMTVKQQLCIDNALVKFNLQHCNPVDTPSAQSLKLRKIERSTESAPYREAVGTLMYVKVATRLDLAFGIQNPSQHLNAFGEEHWSAVKRQLRYLKGTNKCDLVCEQLWTVTTHQVMWTRSQFQDTC